MRALVALSLLLAPAAHADPLLSDRTPMAWHLIGAQADSVRPVAETVLAVRTRLTLVDVLDLGLPDRHMKACGGSASLSCWAGAARDLKTPYLLIVTLHPGRIGALLIDLDRATRAYDHVTIGEEGWRERLDGLIFEDAVVSDFEEVDVSDPGKLEDFLARFFDGPVRGLLETSRHWRENGTVNIETDSPGLTIEIDGEVAGQTQRGTTKISGVAVGPRRVGLIDPTGLVRHEVEMLTVARGETTVLVPALSRGPNQTPTIRAATFWSGVVLAAGGAALLVAAFLVPQDGHDLVTCPGDCPSIDRRLNTFDGSKDGVPIAPFGTGLLGLGLGFSAGTFFVGESHDLPWLPWIMGAVLGGSALAFTAAIH